MNTEYWTALAPAIGEEVPQAGQRTPLRERRRRPRGRWFSAGSARTSRTLPAAPALGSRVPNTTSGMRARTIAPAHIAQGSRVTKRVVPGSRQPPSSSAAARIASSSAWAVGSLAQLALVAGPRQQFAVAEDSGADRHVAVRLGFARLLDRDLHRRHPGCSRPRSGVCPPATSAAMRCWWRRRTVGSGSNSRTDETTSSHPAAVDWQRSRALIFGASPAAGRDRRLAGARVRPRPAAGQVRGATPGRADRPVPGARRQRRRAGAAGEPRVVYAEPNYIATASATGRALRSGRLGVLLEGARAPRA